MKSKLTPFALAVALAFSIPGLAAREYSPAELAQRTLERRAVEAAIWGMPIVSVDAMRQAFLRDAAASYGDVVYWSKVADAKLQITTPNASSYYVFLALNTRDGPLVFEVPPAAGAGIFGSLNDAWQVPQADIGPAGEDGGKGGKYLLLPPGYSGEIPGGYFPVRLATYNSYSWMRAIPAGSSPADVAKALDLVKQVRVYRLAQAANPPASRHIDMAGKLFDGIVRYDDTFYDSLARMVGEEPVFARDKVAMGQLRSLGIAPGAAFKPDSATREILRSGVEEALAGFIQATLDGTKFWTDRNWLQPGGKVAVETSFSCETDDYLEIDLRGMLFYQGCAPPRKLGAATFYLMGMRDTNGAALEGARTYRLRIPPNVPAQQFWAVTVYDMDTAAFLANSPRVGVDSFGQLEKNADGSININFGPKAPAGKEKNWIPTSADSRWFTCFRFYGPEKPLFEKTWQLSNIEEVK